MFMIFLVNENTSSIVNTHKQFGNSKQTADDRGGLLYPCSHHRYVQITY